jgi:molybdopterin biosynthesis enzyme
MISFDEAIELIRSVAKPLGAEAVPLQHAASRVLAEPVIARIDSPRADVSAMDGYAVCDADLETMPARLAVAGESFAGAGWAAGASWEEFHQAFRFVDYVVAVLVVGAAAAIAWRFLKRRRQPADEPI